MSHDLRTPLSTIRAVASDLRDGGGDYDDATRDELLDLVVDEAERLDRLVANLLSLSRVEAGALEPDRQAIALDELFQQCVRRHARLVRDRKVSVDVPLTLPLVDADWTLVDQAVTNLVANAVRHAPEGTRIWVSARRADADWVEVARHRPGPGHPAPSCATPCSSRSGAGRARRRRASASPSSGPSSRPTAARSPSTTARRRRHRRALHPAGAPWLTGRSSSSTTSRRSSGPCRSRCGPGATTCVTATTGQQALDRCATEDPAAVILDLGLPDIDGIEVCRRIRQWSDVPIIVLTAEGADERKVAALDDGADDYVTKPYSTPELLARLRVALRHRARSDGGDEAPPASSSATSWSTSPSTGSRSTASRSRSRRRSSASSPSSPATRRGSSPTGRSSRRCGGPSTGARPSTCGSTPASSARSCGDDPSTPRLVTEPGVGYRLVDPA